VEDVAWVGTFLPTRTNPISIGIPDTNVHGVRESNEDSRYERQSEQHRGQERRKKRGRR
jgi:hypothetical protein